MTLSPINGHSTIKSIGRRGRPLTEKTIAIREEITSLSGRFEKMTVRGIFYKLTLISIAHNLYVDWKEWKAIGAKNGLTDPHRVLPAGKTLKLP